MPPDEDDSEDGAAAGEDVPGEDHGDGAAPHYADPGLDTPRGHVSDVSIGSARSPYADLDLESGAPDEAAAPPEGAGCEGSSSDESSLQDNNGIDDLHRGPALATLPTPLGLITCYRNRTMVASCQCLGHCLRCRKQRTTNPSEADKSGLRGRPLGFLWKWLEDQDEPCYQAPGAHVRNFKCTGAMAEAARERLYSRVPKARKFSRLYELGT